MRTRNQLRAVTFGVCAVMLALFPRAASSELIDFEGVQAGAEGNNIPDLTVGAVTLSFTNAIYAHEGSPTFSHSFDGGSDAPFNIDGNIFMTDILSTEFPYSGFKFAEGFTMTVNFEPAVRNLSFLLADVEILGDESEQVTARVYDQPNGAGSLLFTVVVDGGEDNSVQVADFGAATNIRSLIIEPTEFLTNDNLPVIAYGVDNIRFDAVPEPSSFVLLSFAALGLVAYRRVCRRRQRRP